MKWNRTWWSMWPWCTGKTGNSSITLICTHICQNHTIYLKLHWYDYLLTAIKICVQCQSEFLKLNMDQLGLQGDHLSHSSANVLGTGVINVSNTDSSTHSWRESWPRGIMFFKEVTFCSSLHFNCLLNVNVLGLQLCHQVRHPWNCTTAGNLLLTNLACCKLCIFGDGEILPHWWLLDMTMWHSWTSDVCVYCGDHVAPA